MGITAGPRRQPLVHEPHQRRLGRIDPDDGTIATFADPEIDQNPVISDGITRPWR